jgi:D-3-phosphoglycerate dehydrogenase / 2-oxoglutarate reductase
MNAPRPPRILISDELDPAAHEVFRRAGFEPEIRTGLKEEELCQALAGVDALVVRSATKVTRRVLEAAGTLRVIGRAGIGVDNVDLEAATERGIVVMNTPRGNATTTAELAIALLLALARHIPRADRLVRSGKWKAKGLVGTEVFGKTLGVIGLGRIGRLVAERGRGLSMKVIAHDPYLSGEGIASPVPGVELVELEALLERSDFVSVHVPLNDSTKNMLSWEQLARIKPGARLIQASRGGVVDEEAVLDALTSGKLAGAAFDVFAVEPPPKDHPLLSRDDVIVTPHLGASSEEAQLRVALDIAEQIVNFLKNGVAENAVNAPTLPAEAMAEVAPFLLLAEKLGSFLAQRMKGQIRKVEFTVGGDVTRHGIEHLRLAFLVGVLRHTLDRSVNFVNAPALARERGILVLESREERPDFRNGEISVRASEKAGGLSHRVSGAVFGREPRIVSVDDLRLDLPPRGVLLVTRHKDQPGVLGQIGSILGRYQINIQRLELAPGAEPGASAHGYLTLSPEPPEAVLEALRNSGAIEELQLLKL